MHSLWSRWAPPLERSKLASFTYSGCELGTVIALPVSGALCKYGFAGGWPSVFYVSGTLGCIWFVFWFFLVADTPDKHPRISSAEREYIQNSIGKDITQLSKDPVPWKSIFLSPPVWAITLAHAGHNWGFYTLLTNLPTYMNDILGFEISENGLLSSLPYLVCWLVSIVGGIITDFCIKHKVKIVLCRKFCTSLGLLGPAFALLGISFSRCNYIGVIVAFCIGMGLEGLVFSGYLVNHLDIGTKFAGTLLGISNTAGTIPGILAPVVVGELTKKLSSREQWQKIFWIASSIYFSAAIFYLIFASGEPQPWCISTAPKEEKKIIEINDINNSSQDKHIKSIHL